MELCLEVSSVTNDQDLCYSVVRIQEKRGERRRRVREECVLGYIYCYLMAHMPSHCQMITPRTCDFETVGHHVMFPKVWTVNIQGLYAWICMRLLHGAHEVTVTFQVRLECHLVLQVTIFALTAQKHGGGNWCCLSINQIKSWPLYHHV